MTFLAPLSALLAASIAIPLLVLLYFLKLRRREVAVSSTLLWKKAIQDLQVNAPFQRLRRNLLLLLQLLILIALLIAMARPALRGVAFRGQQVILLIDHSASMNATDAAPSRLEAAKAQALQVVEDLPGDAAAMIVSFAQQAQVVQPMTGDRSLLRSAIRDIQPTDQPTRLGPALQLVEPFAAANSRPVVYVLSDGRIASDSALALRGADLRFIAIGSPAPDNLAIVSFAARRGLADHDAGQVQIFARLTNITASRIDTNLTLALDGQPVRVLPTFVPPVDPKTGSPGSQSLQFAIDLPGPGLLTLSHDHADALAADNSASLTLLPPRQLRALLVTSGNRFLQQAVRAAGAQRLVIMDPARYENADPSSLSRAANPAEGFDVLIFDAYAPKRTPPVDSLYFGAVPPIPGLSRVPGPEGRGQVILDWRRDHPLLQFVTLDDLVLGESSRLVLPDQATILATASTGPVMAQVMTDTLGSNTGTRHVIASFPLLQTNWPMQISFAVFMSNALQTLGGLTSGDTGLSYQPGQVAVIAAPGVDQVRYRGPQILEAPAAGGRAALPMFTRAGVYRPMNSSTDLSPLAVNLADEFESDLRPADRLAVGAADAQAQTVQASTVVRREIWRWFAWAALAVLLVEWLVYTRRMHL